MIQALLLQELIFKQNNKIITNFLQNIDEQVISKDRSLPRLDEYYP